MKARRAMRYEHECHDKDETNMISLDRGSSRGTSFTIDFLIARPAMKRCADSMGDSEEEDV